MQGKSPSSYPFIYTCYRKLWHNGSPSAASLGPVGRAFILGALQHVDSVLRNLLGECDVCGDFLTPPCQEVGNVADSFLFTSRSARGLFYVF